MSKFAVILLPFFIVSLISVEPMVAKTSTDSIVEDLSRNFQINEAESMTSPELLATNYAVSKGDVVVEFDSTTEEPRVMETLVTAYSSTPEETDDSPFITASGNYVRPGVIAANFLAFGTKVKIPEIFGDRIFTVEDRLHSKYNDRIDVWFADKEEALKFGSQITEIEIL